MKKEENKLDVEKEYKETIERFANKKEVKQPEKKPERKIKKLYMKMKMKMKMKSFHIQVLLKKQLWNK